MICKGPNCDTDIYWLVHSETGKKAPIEAQPSREGNVRIKGDGTYEVLTDRELQKARDAGAIGLHFNHFARCPDQGSFR